MENFTVNITGDINIILPHKKIPRRVRLKSDGYAPVSGFQLTPNDEEYDESNVSVLLAVPGQKARFMRLLDALIKTGFRGTHVRQVPTFDLYMAYENKAVVTVSGETYLTGPAIVFYCLDDELWDISSEDAGLVRRLFEERTVQAPPRRRNDPGHCAVSRAPVHTAIITEGGVHNCRKRLKTGQ